jgi:hypothetical protein
MIHLATLSCKTINKICFFFGHFLSGLSKVNNEKKFDFEMNSFTRFSALARILYALNIMPLNMKTTKFCALWPFKNDQPTTFITMLQ